MSSDRTQRVVLWLTAIVLVAGTVVALKYARGYRPLAGIASSTSPLPPDVMLRLEHVRVVGRSGGLPAWKLSAARIDTTRTRSRVTFSGGIHAVLLQEGKPRAEISAPSAAYDALERRLSVAGDIRCRVQDPKSGHTALTIDASDLSWQVDGHLVRSSGTVQAAFADGLGSVQGDQLAVDLRTRNMSMKNVRATFYVEDGNPTPPAALREIAP